VTRILCVGDLHVMDKPPAGATDEYLKDLFASMRFTATWANENDIDAVVWAGDIFHHKNPARTSHATVLKVIEVLKTYDMPLFIVTGNHDISNDVLTSVHEKQPLGVLFQAGAIELDGWAPHLPLFGVPWQQDWHEEGAVERAFEPVRRAEKKQLPFLTVTHASIFPPNLVEDVPYEHLPAEDIASAMNNRGALYYGHIHEDHGVFEVDGVTFCNVGALSRGSLHEYNLKRGIHAAVWEDGEFEVIDIPHMPATDILKVAEHAEKREDKMDLDAFVASVGTSSLDITTTADIVGYIESMDVEKKVKARAVRLVEAVQ